MTTSSMQSSVTQMLTYPPVVGAGPDARLSLMYKILHNYVLIEAITYILSYKETSPTYNRSC